MRPELLELLGCPNCKTRLVLRDAHEAKGEVESGQLVCGACAQQYPIISFIPRFVPAENYAASFGLQWNTFRQTQLDSHSGIPISRERFLLQTGWSPEDLMGKTVLDVGCGAGRFAEVALSCGANLVAIDYSSAADACWQNLAPHSRLNVVQGDIYRLPFQPHMFDFVYCFGVLQHTPDVEKAFLSLPKQLRAGGHLAVDVYPKIFLNLLWPKYWLRYLTKRLPPQRLLRFVKYLVTALLPVSKFIGRTPLVGRKLRYAIPVVNYEGMYPLSKAQLEEWAVMDTFDMLAPLHDHPQSAQTLQTWFKLAGLKEINVFRAGQIVGRGVK